MKQLFTTSDELVSITIKAKGLSKNRCNKAKAKMLVELNNPEKKLSTN
jgi:hypothetical protein